MSNEHYNSSNPSYISEKHIMVQLATMLGHAGEILIQMQDLQTAICKPSKVVEQMQRAIKVHRYLDLVELWIESEAAKKAVMIRICHRCMQALDKQQQDECHTVLEKVLLQKSDSAFSIAHNTLRFLTFIEKIYMVIRFYALENDPPVDTRQFLHVYSGIVKVMQMNMKDYTEPLRRMLEVMPFCYHFRPIVQSSDSH